MRARPSPLALVALLVGSAAVAVAQQTPADSADPWEIAREYYGDEEFDRAIPFIAEAIQRDPLNPQFYLGMARAEYWRGSYDVAVFYYDIYLVDLADRLPEDLPRPNRLDRVRGERSSANDAREDPGAAVLPPAAQEQARALFIERMATGPILTESGGGALALFEGMLRAGYARPDIVELRAQLADALLREAGTLLDDRRAVIPSARLPGWDTQRQRYALWLELGGHALLAAPSPASQDGDDAEAGDGGALEGAIVSDDMIAPGVTASVDLVDRVRSRLAFCEGQLQYLNLSYGRAGETFETALELDPDSLPAHMGRLNTLVRSGRGVTEAAEAALDDFQRAIEAHNPVASATVDVYRAAFASQAGDPSRAAAYLSAILGIPARPEEPASR